MTDRDALYATILDRPEDDTPRLVLADWLDDNPGDVECPACRGKRYCPRCSGEGCSPYGVAANGPCLTDRCATCQSTGYVSNGNAQWAEFIRTQVELARLPDEPFIRVAEAVLAERQSRMSRLERNESRDILLPKCFPEARAIVAERDAKRLELRRWERAEFVRAQVELARQFPGLDLPCVCRATEDKFHCPRCMAWDESESSRERERELWGSWPDENDQRTHFHHLLVGGDPPTEWVILPGSMASDGMGNRAAVVRRGFVDEVRLPLAAFVGTTLGELRRGGRSCCNRHADQMACDCKDVPGLARGLFAAHPILSVRPTDVEPYESGGMWWWDLNGADLYTLPREVFDRVGGEHRTYPTHRPGAAARGFPTRNAALAALSTACVAYGRELAGLRPLPKES